MPKEDWSKNNLKSIFSTKGLWLWRDEEIISVLDVACGLALKSKFLPAQIRVGVDIFEEYLKHIESNVPYAVIKYDVRKLDEIFIPKSFDLVIACDILEHLEKSEGFDLIKEMEKIGRKAVIIESPRGFIPQNIDILGYGGHGVQTHRSVWEPEDLEGLGYQVFLRDYTMSDIKRHTNLAVNIHVRMMDAIKFLE